MSLLSFCIFFTSHNKKFSFIKRIVGGKLSLTLLFVCSNYCLCAKEWGYCVNKCIESWNLDLQQRKGTREGLATGRSVCDFVFDS